MNTSTLAAALRDVLKLIDDRILVRNIENDADIQAFLKQAAEIGRVLKAAQDALRE